MAEPIEVPFGMWNLGAQETSIRWGYVLAPHGKYVKSIFAVAAAVAV